VAPDTPGVARRPEEQDLAPLQHLAVAEPGRVARATTATGSLVVDGAGGALPLLADAGLLEDHPAVRLLGSMSGRDLATAVADGSRIVLTDTNRRRVHDPVRVGAAFSPTLGPDDTVADGAARALWDTDHQTVALLDGAADVSATAAGSPFGPVPWGAPEHAFDGDWRTAWTFGAFGSALGQSVTVEFEEPRALSRVDLRPLVDVGTRIAEVEVRAGDVAVSAELPAGAAVASVLLPPVTADDLTIEVTRTEGVGDNAVGLREIEIAGVAVDPYQRLPLGLTRLLQLRDEPAETLLADTPVDVLLQRQAHAPATDRDDEERRLDRAFTLPVARTHDVAGTLRLGPDVPDDVVDALFADLDVRATSSSRDFDQLAVRASAALDGDVRTAWQPGLGTVGEWLDVTFPRQRLEELTITQGRLDGQATTPVTEVRVTVDDRPPVTARLDGRRTTVDLPDRRASRVRVEVTGTGERVGPVRIAELDLGPDVVVPAVEDDAVPGRCLEAATIDGDPVQVRLDATFAELASGRAVPVRTCGRVHLDAGQHRLTAAPGVLLERLHLRDRLPGPSPTRAVPVDVQRPSPTHLAVDVPATDVPVLVSSGQAMDAGWRARLDGEDLGAPLLLDGYAAGWRVPAGPARRVVVDYAPQRTAEVTRVLSAVALAACVLLVLARRRGRR
jgi:arabinofuranan 3-O-arabinosyltransferase